MYDLNELHSFVALVDSGSLTNTARQLDVSKSTLSRRIAALEHKLGHPLMLRQGNRMRLNDSGQAFYPYARQILDTAQAAQQDVDSLHETVHGSLQVSVSPALSRSWFPTRLFEFLQAYPEVLVNLKTQPPSSQMRTADVSVWLGPFDNRQLKSERLALLDCGIYMSSRMQRDHELPNHPSELAQFPWINMHHFLWPDTELYLEHPDHARVRLDLPSSRLHSDQLMMQQEAIAFGQGLGILPNYFASVRNRRHPGELVPVLPDWKLPPVPLYVITRFGRQPKRVDAFVAHLRAAASDIVAAGR